MGRLSGSPASLDQYIANQFMKHQVSFYHADNIEQVFTHCENNRLLTRRELIDINPTGKTGFYSDDMDTDLGFDDRIFRDVIPRSHGLRGARFLIPKSGWELGNRSP